MAWGNSNNVTQNNLGSGTDDPSQARVELFNALTELIAVINGRGTALGVAPLDSNTKIENTYLPNTITSSASTDLTISPTTEKTNFENIINLNPQTVAELELLTGNEGDIAFCSDGNGGDGCLAVSLGENDSQGSIWYRITLGTQIEDAS